VTLTHGSPKTESDLRRGDWLDSDVGRIAV
jgi:hypothetical protein